MILNYSKKCFLAFNVFVFIHVSLYSFSAPFNTAFSDYQMYSSNNYTIMDDSRYKIIDDCNDTAFAFLNLDEDELTVDNESSCFIPQFNRWGWTTFLDFSEETGQTSYVLDFYAGAGQCNLSNGSDVGDITVTYNEDSSVTFEYNLEGFTLSEAHIYIGENKYPINTNGTETVAPGKYTFTDSELGDVSTYSATIPVEGNEFYIIVHGVTQEEDCGDDNNDDDNDDNDDDCDDTDNDGICDSDDICPGHDDTVDSDGDGIPDGCDNGVYSPQLFKIYPMPFKNKLNIQFAFDYETFVKIEIFDTKGVKLKEQIITNYTKGTQRNARLDLSNISNQLMFIQLTTVKKQFIKKIISSNSK